MVSLGTGQTVCRLVNVRDYTWLASLTGCFVSLHHAGLFVMPFFAPKQTDSNYCKKDIDIFTALSYCNKKCYNV